MKKFTYSIKEEEEIKIEKMVKTWDMVRCYNCGKVISMMNASTINDGQRFVCKNGKCYGEK